MQDTQHFMSEDTTIIQTVANTRHTSQGMQVQIFTFHSFTTDQKHIVKIVKR